MQGASGAPVTRVYVEREVVQEDSSVIGAGSTPFLPFQVSGESAEQHVREETLYLENA